MQQYTIMIIDDDADDRTLLINAVKEVDENIECISAKDGQSALDFLHENKDKRPHLIFLDLRMPRLNGKKVLLELKGDTELKLVPIIIYTTSTEVQESIELKELGAVHFVSKPSNPEEIYYMVSIAIEEHLSAFSKADRIKDNIK